MNVIGRKSALAFRAGKNFSMSNTTVTVGKETGVISMYLHGNKIAMRDPAKQGLSMVSVSLAGWGTPTTRARLNALLEMLGCPVGFYQKKGDQYLGDEMVDSDDWNTIGTRC